MVGGGFDGCDNGSATKVPAFCDTATPSGYERGFCACPGGYSMVSLSGVVMSGAMIMKYACYKD